MNKKIIIIVLCLFSVLNGYGQLSWNAKAGMNVSKTTNYFEPAMKPGYQFGVGMDYYFTEHWGIQPSLILISKGVKDKFDTYFGYDIGYHEHNALLDFTENRIYLEMPVMLAYRVNISNAMKLVFNGGGYISYGIGGKIKQTYTLYDGSTEKFNPSTFFFFKRTQKFDFGLGAGTALEFKNRYIISLFGEWGLKNAYTWIESSNRKIANQSYGLNIGYKF